jgi:spermidine/putrescine transport system substrate-binding protein
VAEQDLHAQLQRIAGSKISRRGFLQGSTFAAASAFLAACSSNGSAATAGTSAAASSAAGASAGASASAGATAVPSFAVPADIEKELFMYNWADYVDPGSMQLFQDVFGVEKFTYDTFASNEEMLAKLQAGGTGLYDFGAPTAEYTPDMHDQGLIADIDWSKIPNAKYIDKQFKGLWWDPDNKWQLPKDWGTTGITKRNKFVTEPVKTWKEFFEVAPKYSGKIVVVDSMGDVFVAPLKALGYSLNSVDPKELNEARKLLLDLAPHVLALNSDTYEVPIKNEEAVLGLTWTGGVVELRDEEATKDVEYIVPEDGTLYWMDTWVIFKDGPHPNAAHAFLNFIHDPQIQAQETITNRYATPNDEAKKYVPKEILDDPAVFVPQKIFDSGLLEGAKNTSTDPLRNQIWEEFRSKIGA